MEKRYSRDIDFWKFLNLLAISKLKEKKEAMDLLVFELFDGDNNGFINIVDIYDLITVKETKGLAGVHSDLKRIKRELQEKAINGPKEELETAINFRRFQQLVPRPAFFDAIRASMHSNYQRRKELVRRFQTDSAQ
jgi:Ca2+-binding EF-hand superfamily protein